MEKKNNKCDALDILEDVFKVSKKIIDWFISKGFFDTKKGGNIVGISFILTGIILDATNDKIVQQITVSIFSCILFFIMYITYFMFNDSKTIKLIYKKEKSPCELFKEFTHISYLYGLTSFSLVTWFMMLVILFFGSGMNIGKVLFSSNMSSNIFFIILATFTVMWFMYHTMFNKDISIGLIKVRLNLYVAIATTLSTIIILPFFQSLLKPAITSIGISYVWLKYLIEKADIKLKIE